MGDYVGKTINRRRDRWMGERVGALTHGPRESAIIHATVAQD